MSQKSLPAHRDYADSEAALSPDAEPSYDGPDQGYDAIDNNSDFDADPDGGDQVDADAGLPAPDIFPPVSLDVFPETLFDDEPKLAPQKRGPGHGDS